MTKELKKHVCEAGVISRVARLWSIRIVKNAYKPNCNTGNIVTTCTQQRILINF